MEMTRIQFKRNFSTLIILAWTVPAVFGLSFLIYIEMFTPKQMLDILTSPIEPIFVLGSLFLAFRYFNQQIKPVCQYIEQPDAIDKASIIQNITRFPLRFWSVFLIYLIIAPITVILSAEWFSDFTATPIDWFRINLVALIVSIIVGLPIFIMIMDLFGRITGQLEIEKPIVSIQLKVFLVGSLVPLLIDTMLVQYYWTRTGYFTSETFFIWFALELLAIAGSLIFVKSFSQSLAPLNAVVKNHGFQFSSINQLIPQSTDELGILTIKYAHLLQELQNEQLQLEQKVNERTAELADANKELKSFSYSVSHDLRAPLRHILSFSQILKEEHSDQMTDEMVDCVERICASAQRMSKLIEQMLRLAQISQQEIQCAEVDLSLFVNYHLELLKQLDPERNVVINIEPELMSYGDDSLLMIAIENLVNNAWKYTSKCEQAEITFGFDRNENAFFLKDNGAGFNMQYANKLFEPFERLHSQNEFEGTGVGLATVYRIIKKHNGKIWADSEPGHGATFYFQLNANNNKSMQDEPK